MVVALPLALPWGPAIAEEGAPADAGGSEWLVRFKPLKFSLQHLWIDIVPPKHRERREESGSCAATRLHLDNGVVDLHHCLTELIWSLLMQRNHPKAMSRHRWPSREAVYQFLVHAPLPSPRCYEVGHKLWQSSQRGQGHSIIQIAMVPVLTVQNERTEVRHLHRTAYWLVATSRL